MKTKIISFREGNLIHVVQVFMDGSRIEIAQFLLPNDGRWRLDVEFHDDILEAYRKRLLRR